MKNRDSSDWNYVPPDPRPIPFQQPRRPSHVEDEAKHNKIEIQEAIAYAEADDNEIYDLSQLL